jgi:hypothetical protein
MIIVHSYFEFLTKAQYAEDVLLLMIKSDDHEQSQIACRNLEEAYQFDSNTPIFKANSNRIPEIQRIYELDGFPSLIIFKNGKYVRTISGCRDVGYYATILDSSDADAKMNRWKSSLRVTDPLIKG